MKKYVKWVSTGLLAAAFLSSNLATTAQAGEKGPTIVDIALAVNAATATDENPGEFSTLIAALDAAGLVSALDGKRQFTVFAPTDAAFAKLGLNAENIGTLDIDFLTNVLLYHVAPGNRPAEDVVESTKIRMLNKQFAAVEIGEPVNGLGVYVGGSEILDVDIFASNGVIHIVDSVLLPPTPTKPGKKK
jgi:uncharacterized surface protein with fasciclin (FAS1) repeats